eukprot:SAG22_NODE_333_length_12162_cov_11.415237_3_plen_490_part_00
MLTQEMVRCRFYTRIASCLQHGYLLPDFSPGRNDQGEESSLIIEPRPGVYCDNGGAICVLDFASLYPSILVGFNLCFSTLLEPGTVPSAENDENADAFETVQLNPHNVHRFARASTRKGLVPIILEELLAKRKAVKRRMRNAVAEEAAGGAGVLRTPGGGQQDGGIGLSKIYDSQQKAFKLAANAFYGFLGAPQARLRCLPAQQCTLFLGRQLLTQAQQMVESTDQGARVIYGDTDSVFVQYSHCSRADAEARGRAAADMVTKALARPPVMLEYEKCYGRFVIQGVKTYAGALFDQDVQNSGRCYDDDEASLGQVDIKGFECIKKDTAPYIADCVRQVLEARVRSGAQAAKAVAVTCVLEVLKQAVPKDRLSCTRALKLWVSQPQSQPGAKKAKASAASPISMYDTTTAHTALATRLERRHGIQFAAGQRLPFLFCAVAAATAKRARTGNKKAPLWERAVSAADGQPAYMFLVLVPCLLTTKKTCPPAD